MDGLAVELISIHAHNNVCHSSRVQNTRIPNKAQCINIKFTVYSASALYVCRRVCSVPIH
jgi:hypothetical protein